MTLNFHKHTPRKLLEGFRLCVGGGVHTCARVCAYMHAHVLVYSSVNVKVRRQLCISFSVILYLTFLRQGLSLNLIVSILSLTVWPVGSDYCLCLQLLSLQSRTGAIEAVTMLDFHEDARKLDSGPQACTANYAY